MGRRAPRIMVLEAIFWLLIVRAAIWALPFRHVARRLGTLQPPSDAFAGDSFALRDKNRAHQVGWVVARATKWLPVKMTCLHQAMAAKAMLKRRGIDSALHFGAAGSEFSGSPFEAHAWLDSAGVKVTGYPAAADFTKIASLV